jgi:class 3 adenylate cyclase
VQPIGEWLASIGLAPTFTDNDIDVSVLPYLTDADLERIGISLGHRRKILAAIAELVGGVQSSPQPVKSAAKPQETAERRQVTVMCSDLSVRRHSRRAWTRHDLREVASAYQKCVARVCSEVHGRRGAGVFGVAAG